jgi:hypothetical protein
MQYLSERSAPLKLLSGEQNGVVQFLVPFSLQRSRIVMSSQRKAQQLFDKLEKIKAQVQERLNAAEESSKLWQQIQTDATARLKELKTKIKINVGGKVFSTSKSTLLMSPGLGVLSVFSVMLSTKLWDPEDGIYFFDRNPAVFNHVLDYMADGSVLLDILGPVELALLKEDLEFFHVPYFVDEAKNGSLPRIFHRAIFFNISVAALRLPDSKPAGQQKDVAGVTQPRLQSGENEVYLRQGQAYRFHKASFDETHPQHALVSSAVSIFDDVLALDSSIHTESVEVVYKVERFKLLTDVVKTLAAASKDQISLEFRDKMFATCKSTLVKTPWFEAQVTRWEPDPDTGAYFIDRNPRFVNLILDYLRSGKWKMDGFDNKLMPVLLAELEYFHIDNTPNTTISWDPSKMSSTIQLSEDNQIATSAEIADWHLALGTAPVKYVKYQLKSAYNGTNCLVGLDSPTRTLTGGQYYSSGYYIDLSYGNQNSQQGGGPMFYRALATNGTIEFRYDILQKTISVRYGNVEFEQVWSNVTGDLTAAAELYFGPHSIEIVASEI